jgi:nickel-dependent lactate racemase
VLILGKGSTTEQLSVEDTRRLITQACNNLSSDHKRILVIIPDGTRTAPIPLIFRLLYEQLGTRVAQLDYLIALGTHQPMTDDAIDHLVGVTLSERTQHYPKVHIFNHQWSQPAMLQTIGVISRNEAEILTNGLLVDEVVVTLNRMILDYDQLIICGPVFPHEVAGFSGGAKYLFPGIAGPDTIGVKDTPVRRVMHRAAEFVPRPILCMALVLKSQEFHGLYIGSPVEAFNAAADLSAQLNIIHVEHPFKHVLSIPSAIYDDLWTAAKAMYKTEPAIADGGEVIIYAPHITEVSYTHGKLIDSVGYHVRDYFLKQWERFKTIPGSILAHSTHVKGAGTYDASNGIEKPRIQVTLATGIPEERCKRINLGYKDYREINPQEWSGREEEGILLVPHAGEMLYRARI